tara:strand:+ start:55180 stop:55356 length:177 start_codon:yes stop_codon:yes gene_type:complete
LSVFYSEIIPVLTKAIQEQQQVIELQVDQTKEMSSEINRLKSLEERVLILEASLKTEY